MKTVQIQSKYESSEHNVNIFYNHEKSELKGKTEYTHLFRNGKEKQHVTQNITISENEIAVEDIDEYYSDNTVDSNTTKYVIRMPKLHLILDYDIFEKIKNAIDTVFDRPEKEDVKVVYAKNIRKIESKDVFVEINANKMYMKAKDLEINDLKFDYLEIEVSSTSNLINDDTDFGPEVYEGEKAKDAISLINIRIHRILEPLLFLQAELRCVFY